MSISDKTRKLLWGRSGNRCAICRRELSVASTPLDDDSVVGDECHIISAELKGPRHDPHFLVSALDSYENLILLCRVHHKQVDDQAETYSPDLLRTLKCNHERHVAEKLDPSLEKPVRLRRIPGKRLEHLHRVTTGADLFNIVSSSHAYDFENEELHSKEEVDLVGGILQTMQDYGEISSNLEAGDRVEARFELSNRLKELENAGFWIFGGREPMLLDGGAGPASYWHTAVIRILRRGSKFIIEMDETSSMTPESTVGQI